jgi:DNA-binding response OmpR family regulator
MKILIAEDDLPSRCILEGLLTKWGYDVIAVSNGKDAIDRLLDTNAPKLALLDWMMPDKDGIEVCHIVRHKETTSPSYIILLTGKGNKKDITKGLESGADDYIVKPYDKDELRARINVGQRMIQLQKVLAEKEKLDGIIEMAGAVCHEMNQPMQVVSGLSELLLMDIREGNPFYGNIQEIKSQIDRMGGITKKLMNITIYETKNYLKGNIIDIDKASKKKIHNLDQ